MGSLISLQRGKGESDVLGVFVTVSEFLILDVAVNLFQGGIV